jgi:pimeloyl-ACP methyl ester carboxylesterase
MLPYADNKGIRIHYKTEGDGPPLVMHHWSLASLEWWYDFGYVSSIKDDYNLILLDARGHGSSDKPHDPEAYDIKHRVSDVIAVLDDLEIEKAHFLGYSMGGWVGFGLARYGPDRFHSLIIGGAHPYAQSMERIRQLVRQGIEHGAEAFIKAREKTLGVMSSEQRERMSLCDFNALMAVAQDRPDESAVLPTMKMPCLIFVGELDAACQLARESAQHVLNSRFVVLPALDHSECIKHSDLLVPQVRRFLSGVQPQD